MDATRRRLAQRGLVALHWSLLATVWGYLSVRAFLNLQPDYDFLAYHLPFALMHVGRTSFRPLPHLMFVYEGFPPLAEWMQGILVVLTGRLSAACGVGIIGLGLALTSVLLVRPAFPLRWYLTMLLAVPFVVTHSGSGYIDLWGASTLLMAFVGADRLLAGGDDWRALISLELGLAMASLTKFTLWPFCFLIGAGACYALTRRWTTGTLPTRRWVTHALVVVVAVSVFPIRNVLRFGNPTYPWQPPFLHTTLPGFFTRDAAETVSVPQYLIGKARPRRFIESALELNRLRSDAPFRWEIDQGRYPRDSPHFRMGGWFFVTVVGMALSLVAAYAYDPSGRPALALFLACVLLVLEMPANNELRYWLFVPMVGLFLVAKALPRMPAIARYAVQTLFAAASLYVLSQTAWVFTGRFLHTDDVVPPAARAFWARQQGAPPSGEWLCIKGMQQWTIFWAGPTLTEYRVQACF